MAAVEDMVKKFTGADEKAMAAKERLELLKNAAQAHLTISESHISEMLHGQGGGISDLFIIPGSVQNFQQGYTVSTGETADKGISAAVDQFFSGEYKEGFKTVIKSAISILFADTTAGEQVKNYYFVTMEHNAFIRVDVAFWKYYFEQKSLADKVEQAFCYTFVKSIIDHKKVDVSTIIYLVSSQVGDDLEKVEGYLEAIRKLYAKLEPESTTALAARVLPRLEAADAG